MKLITATLLIAAYLLAVVAAFAQRPVTIETSGTNRGKFTDPIVVEANSGTSAGTFAGGQATQSALDAKVTDGPQPAYLMTAFQTGVPSIEELSLLASSGGKNFARLSAGTVYTPPSGTVRDPSIRFQNGNYYVAHTRNGFSAGLNFGIAVSSNLRDWEQLTVVEPTGLGSNTHLWSPEWFEDDDGKVYILFASGSPYQIYIIEATSPDLTTWSAATQITGTSLPTGMIDPFMVKVGSTYHIFYKNESTLEIGYMSSSSLTSGYTVTNAGIDTFGTHVEGVCVVPIDDDTWRLFYTLYSGPVGIYYSDSTDDWATWSEPARAAYGLTAEDSDGTFFHGTVVKVNDTKTLLDMMALNTSESLVKPGNLAVTGDVEVEGNVHADRFISPNIVNSGTAPTSPTLTLFSNASNVLGLDVRSGYLGYYSAVQHRFYTGSTESTDGTLGLTIAGGASPYIQTTGTAVAAIFRTPNNVGSGVITANLIQMYSDAGNLVGFGVRSGMNAYAAGTSARHAFWVDSTPSANGTEVVSIQLSGVYIRRLGSGITVPMGSNSKHGSATLTSGTATVTTTAITGSSTILIGAITGTNSSTGIGVAKTVSIVSGTSFSVSALKSDGTVETGDNSTFRYLILDQ